MIRFISRKFHSLDLAFFMKKIIIRNWNEERVAAEESERMEWIAFHSRTGKTGFRFFGNVLMRL
jgi:hypothetical protein